MEASVDASPPAVPVVVTVGFGTAVAMWTVGYFGRLPAVSLPGPWLVGLFLLCLFSGGLLLGRHARLGAWHGAAAGLVTGTLNLLVLGGLLAGERGAAAAPSALLWLPGSIAVASALPALGALAGRRWTSGSRYEAWPAAFARVTVLAALLLLAVGGLVTSTDSGLAVADWPNSRGYNMFLYPLSRMTGGIYFEHAHRLFGALVGLTTVMLATLLHWQEPRRWVRRLGWLAVAMVILQGILGGLRVTGSFTLSQDEGLAPRLALALVHGVFGQVFFATLVVLAVVTSPGWLRPAATGSGATDRLLTLAVVGALVVQLLLGAIQRHLSQLLLLHITMGVGVVLPLAVHAGFRAWGLHPERPVLRRAGLALVAAAFLQVLLGLGAFLARRTAGVRGSSALEVAVATAHQWFGAVLLGTAVVLTCWAYRRHQVSAPAGSEERVY